MTADAGDEEYLDFIGNDSLNNKGLDKINEKRALYHFFAKSIVSKDKLSRILTKAIRVNTSLFCRLTLEEAKTCLQYGKLRKVYKKSNNKNDLFALNYINVDSNTIEKLHNENVYENALILEKRDGFMARTHFTL